MNPTIQAILAMLELMWQAAYEDANQDVNHPDTDLTEVDQAITRMETIADVIDAIITRIEDEKEVESND